MKPSARIWTRDFSLLWLGNFLLANSFYFLLPTLPLFAVAVLRVETSQVGYLTGIFTLAAVLIRPLAGYALDSIGRRPVYLWALVGFALMASSYQFATAFVWLLALRMLHGLAWGIATTGGGTAAADLLPASRRGEGVGYFGMSMTLAMALGPLFAIPLATQELWSALFTLSGGLAVVALVVALLIRFPRLPRRRPKITWSSFVEPRVLPVGIITFLSTMAYGSIVSYITLYSDQIGIANSGLFFLIYAVSMSLSRPTAGKIQDARGPVPVLTTGLISMMAGLLLLALSRELILFSAASVLLGIGMGCVMPSLQTMVINLVEPERRGVANSTYFSALDLGIGTGAMLLGALAGRTSLSIMYAAAGLLLLLPLALLHLSVADYYHQRVPRAQPE